MCFASSPPWITSPKQLQKLLGGTHSGLRVRAVTGAVGDEQRREIVDGRAEEKVRVLVATDCLSEDINLQKDFDAIVHFEHLDFAIAEFQDMKMQLALGRRGLLKA